ncbi:MAG: hypothetical protein ACR5K4_00340 [Sodalis sp. (in: enterobacteria)]
MWICINHFMPSSLLINTFMVKNNKGFTYPQALLYAKILQTNHLKTQSDEMVLTLIYHRRLYDASRSRSYHI